MSHEMKQEPSELSGKKSLFSKRLYHSEIANFQYFSKNAIIFNDGIFLIQSV